ncbi:MAG: 3-phosphoshikimate 1-carboxyvinyltransferase, partial [Coriobacteriia bacterium]|nr:3-phosphoshikimate 1-carboxyvinyltransferase [Coriobacteriia bacterium]
MSDMNNLSLLEPLPGPLDGCTRVPGDKSISHRAVLFSAMAEGTSRLTGVLDSADVRSSIAAARKLGAQVSLGVQADGSLAGGITGWGAAGPSEPDGIVDCGNSGTTVRLLMGIVGPWPIRVLLTGDDSLVKRPMRRIMTPLTKMGVRFEPEEAETLPLTVVGNPRVKAITYDSPVASAQVKTAVMLAGTRADGCTTVNEPAPSRNHTELMLPEFGVKTTASLSSASVEGPAILKASEVDVPGDPSSAAFVVCAALLKPGSTVQVENVSLAPTRIGFVRTLERMGASIEVRTNGVEGKEPKGIIEVAYTDKLVGCEVPPQHIASEIDEIPVLALVAARAQGVTVFRGV